MAKPVFVGLALWVCGVAAADPITLRSPERTLTASIDVHATGALVYSVERAGMAVIQPSRIGVTVDGVDLGESVTVGVPVTGTVDETYSIPGGKSVSRNHACTLSLPVKDRKSGLAYTLEARAFDDGFAWRLLIPGTGARHVTGEASSWTLPAKGKIWFSERNSAWKLKSYAGEYVATDLAKLPTVSSQGPVQCPPLVVELPSGGGYAVITEAALANYSGLRLRAAGEGRLQADFTEGAKGFVVDGPITTPWRVTLAAADLNTLVNSDVITALNPAPDAALFADRSYINPGRCVWRWWSRGTGTPEQERAMIDDAAALGFEYTLIDDGWKAWPDAWSRIAALCAYGREHGVGVFIWKDCNDVSNPAGNYAALRGFLDSARVAGVAGVKLDFFNSETKGRIDFQRAVLRMTAERRLMVLLHGVQKPTGEARTFPNEITREGIRGLELNKMAEGPIPPAHNAALPFTRYLAGHGDYTPLGYSHPRATTWAHQLATVVQGTSPLLVIAEDTDVLLRDEKTRPALDVLKAIPSTWDETRVLAPSRIGELAILARRSGTTWFLAILNGSGPVSVKDIDLSFLGAGSYKATLITSPSSHALARRELTGMTAQIKLTAELAAGDGWVAWFRP